MIALVSTASAALLLRGVSPYVVIPLMLVMGIALGAVMGWIIQTSQSTTFYCHPDGSFLRSRYGLYHQSDFGDH